MGWMRNAFYNNWPAILNTAGCLSLYWPLREAISEGATDIHVEPMEEDLRIRFRLDGVLHPVSVPPSTPMTR